MSRLLSPSPVTRRRLYFLTFVGSLLTLLYLLWWTSSLSSPLSSLPSLQLYPQTASSSGQAISDLVQPQGSPEMTQQVQDLRTFLRDARKQALDHLNGSQRGDRPLVMIMGNGAGGECRALPASSDGRSMTADKAYLPLEQTWILSLRRCPCPISSPTTLTTRYPCPRLYPAMPSTYL